jgi:guanylate kinase
MLGKLFIVSASSGAGKTSLVEKVIERLGTKYLLKRLITYTTKKPRNNEVHGKDYYFISVDEFKTKIEQGFFIEWSTAYGAYYGSPKDCLHELQEGTSTIAIVDLDGASAIKDFYAPAIAIWLQAPSLESLKKRLIMRSTESEEQIAHRCKRAEFEAQAGHTFFNYRLINDNFDVAASEFEALIKKHLEIL